MMMTTTTIMLGSTSAGVETMMGVRGKGTASQPGTTTWIW
jgi:hypothetical protein